jgi:hypothetical protein
MPPRHTRDAIVPLPRDARSTDNLLLARIIAPAKVIAEPCLALVVAATSSAKTGVVWTAFGAETPVAVVVCVAVGGFFAGVAAGWVGWEAADWWAWCGFVGRECEDVSDGVGVA